jgi:hypothetical protein
MGQIACARNGRCRDYGNGDKFGNPSCLHVTLSLFGFLLTVLRPERRTIDYDQLGKLELPRNLGGNMNFLAFRLILPKENGRHLKASPVSVS